MTNEQRRRGPLRLLAVGTVTPRKGHLLLIEALADLREFDWRLTCIGSLERDRATAEALRRAIAAKKLGDRVALVGECPPELLTAAYRDADIFVLPSYQEGYGMAYAEALAHGLPIIATTAGAIPDTVPATASLLVPPGDAVALRNALRRMFTDANLRARLAAGAALAAAALPDWPTAVSLGRRLRSACRMSGFKADWLQRREPFDAAARDRDLARRFGAVLGDGQNKPRRIVDLAAGSGANFRALAPLLGGDQDWLLVDHDPLLIAAQAAEIARWSTRNGWHCQEFEWRRVGPDRDRRLARARTHARSGAFPGTG